LRDIPIEDRDGDELRIVRGRSAGIAAQVAIADAATRVANPAFDVTPARIVTGIITERGVAAPEQLAAMFKHERR
jgi:methylthioribose-1-phosphate isomerase